MLGTFMYLFSAQTCTYLFIYFVLSRVELLLKQATSTHRTIRIWRQKLYGCVLFLKLAPLTPINFLAHGRQHLPFYCRYTLSGARKSGRHWTSRQGFIRASRGVHMPEIVFKHQMEYNYLSNKEKNVTTKLQVFYYFHFKVLDILFKKIKQCYVIINNKMKTVLLFAVW